MCRCNDTVETFFNTLANHKLQCNLEPLLARLRHGHEGGHLLQRDGVADAVDEAAALLAARNLYIIRSRILSVKTDIVSESHCLYLADALVVDPGGAGPHVAVYLSKVKALSLSKL